MYKYTGSKIQFSNQDNAQGNHNWETSLMDIYKCAQNEKFIKRCYKRSFKKILLRVFSNCVINSDSFSWSQARTAQRSSSNRTLTCIAFWLTEVYLFSISKSMPTAKYSPFITWLRALEMVCTAARFSSIDVITPPRTLRIYEQGGQETLLIENKNCNQRSVDKRGFALVLERVLYMSDCYASEFNLKAQEYVTWVIASMELDCATVVEAISMCTKLANGRGIFRSGNTLRSTMIKTLPECGSSLADVSPPPSRQSSQLHEMRMNEFLSQFHCTILTCDRART